MSLLVHIYYKIRIKLLLSLGIYEITEVTIMLICSSLYIKAFIVERDNNL
jgi:hypothetical protein